MTVGDKVKHHGLCYRIVGIKDGIATIKPCRTTKRNPRARQATATRPVASLTPWKTAA